MTDKIDFVVTWVDGSDEKWIQRKKNVERLKGLDYNYDAISRYRDMATFKYWFRAVEQNAPWVNKVYLVTDNQVPEWLNLANSKVRVIDHTEIITQKDLPTYNSNAIELSFAKIPGLSEKFVLFNDDTFVNRRIEPDFFFKKDRVRDTKAYTVIVPAQGGSYFSFNDVEAVNRKFKKNPNWLEQLRLLFDGNLNIFLKNIMVSPYKKITGYYDPHMPIPYFKSSFEAARLLAADEWDATVAAQFRNERNINHMLVRYLQLEQGRYLYQNPKLNKYYSIVDIKKVCADIQSGKHFMICVNDTDDIGQDQFDTYKKQLVTAFELRYGRKSSFEV